MKLQSFSDKTIWTEFTLSFLDIAKLACEKCEEIEKNNEFTTSHYYIPTLKISIIYNIKHALELLLKLLIRTIDNDLNELLGGKDGHNIEFLLLKLQNKIPIKELKSIEDKIEDPYAREFFSNVLKNLDDQLEELRQLVIKYNQLKFLKQDLIQLEDYNNTAFKYPENKFQIYASIDYFNFIFHNGHDSIKILMLHEDINNLRVKITNIGRVFEIYHWHKNK